MGILYVVATPIGNLKDITIRGLQTLRDVDFIAAENIKRAKKLLSVYDIKTKIISYREENRERATRMIIDKINDGKNIALISDAGTPTVSDPGDYLIKKCVEGGIPVVPVPGPSSIICALSVSGLDTSEFSFLGFLARKGKKRLEQISKIEGDGRTSVIFESPKRIAKTLSDILNIIGERKAAVCRELTKLNEEVIRGSLSVIIDELEKRGEIKGEIVLMVSGGGGIRSRLDRDDLISEVKKYVEQNPEKKTKEVAKILAARLGVSVKEIYKIAVGERED